jgi:hypothetical protein
LHQAGELQAASARVGYQYGPVVLRQGPPGTFRATFEDKILMSDIVFLRTWYPIKPVKLYNPVTSLLMADAEKWNGAPRPAGRTHAAHHWDSD